ncbi:N-acetylmuramoyl-L-alanine amidase [Deinococcus multiflagellatus]|uniref:N-acetylmuramoyl-L-alanine amidase n=1 Tax=Deinococcus multiflagellatus TaxID=1656887 RepID=UPI001CCE34A4|nr:N-acetylmuramoyl-L-alanine amidase [Deinococcus multiflagellatus]MBZ9715132.1 N-acetylmuramoyl-L-alanine amidase [Deinococcus multiflagellatus]
MKAARSARPRAALRLLSAGLLLLGLAGAQIAFSRLNLAGQPVDSIQLYGAEYASQSVLSGLLTVTREGQIVRVTGLGHTLLLPIDEDQQRATTDFNTVQLDTRRLQARAATLVNGNLYLPVDTLAAGLGAQYEPGKLTVPAPQLLGVSSRAGRDTDRLVLDLSRDVAVQDEQRGDRAVITLRGLKGETRRYTTRGAFVPSVDVARSGEDLTVTLPLNAGSGYRVYKVVRPGNVRVVVDAGPGVARSSPQVLTRVTAPLIVLDPVRVPGVGRDVTLEVARRAAELLSKFGWQVRMTRDASQTLSREDALRLTRQSDVYLALDLGRLPGAQRSGVTVYEQTGRASAPLINTIRAGAAPPYSALVVAGPGSTRRLGELLRGELKAKGVTAGRETTSRVLSLGEAPQAALLLELGWAGNAEDLAKLGVNQRLQLMAEAVARSVATYLTARANNNANISAGAAGAQP